MIKMYRGKPAPASLYLAIFLILDISAKYLYSQQFKRNFLHEDPILNTQLWFFNVIQLLK